MVKMHEKSFPVDFDIVQEQEAQIIFPAIRKAIQKQYSALRIIGFKIIDRKNPQRIFGNWATFPGSTDLICDIMARLATSNYLVKNDISSTFRAGSKLAKVGQVFAEKNSNRLMVLSYVKSFSNSAALSYGDLCDLFEFYGVDNDMPIVHVQDPSVELEFQFVIGEISGLADETQNYTVYRYVMGEDDRFIATPTYAMTGIELSYDISKQRCRFLIRGNENDKRVELLKESLQHTVNEFHKAYKTARVLF